MKLPEHSQRSIGLRTWEWEVTYYLALAHQADANDLPEAAAALRRIAAGLEAMSSGTRDQPVLER